MKLGRTKRSRLLAILMALAMCLSVLFVSVGAVSGSQVAADGTYTATSDQSFTKKSETYQTTVELVVKDGLISNFSASGAQQKDNAEYLADAEAGLKNRIVGKEAKASATQGVDAISDATYSSEMILEAIDKALASAPAATAEKVKYTVSFNMNGHGTQIANQTVEEGSTPSVPSNPTADGYTFNGWYSNAALTALYNFSAPITSNTTVYAKWSQNETPVIPDPQPGTTPTIVNPAEATGNDLSLKKELVYDKNSDTYSILLTGKATAAAQTTGSGYIQAGWDKEFTWNQLNNTQYYYYYNRNYYPITADKTGTDKDKPYVAWFQVGKTKYYLDGNADDIETDVSKVGEKEASKTIYKTKDAEKINQMLYTQYPTLSPSTTYETYNGEVYVRDGYKTKYSYNFIKNGSTDYTGDFYFKFNNRFYKVYTDYRTSGIHKDNYYAVYFVANNTTYWLTSDGDYTQDRSSSNVGDSSPSKDNVFKADKQNPLYTKFTPVSSSSNAVTNSAVLKDRINTGVFDLSNATASANIGNTTVAFNKNTGDVTASNYAYSDNYGKAQLVITISGLKLKDNVSGTTITSNVGDATISENGKTLVSIGSPSATVPESKYEVSVKDVTYNKITNTLTGNSPSSLLGYPYAEIDFVITKNGKTVTPSGGWTNTFYFELVPADTSIAKEYAKNDLFLELPEPAKSGKTKVTLNLYENINHGSTSSGQKGKLLTTTTFNLTVTPATVTWIVKSSDSNIDITTSSVDIGSKPTNTKTPTKDHAKFVGWSTNENDTTGKAVSALPAATGDITYYAIFEEDPNYDITFKNEAGNNTLQAGQVLKGDTPIYTGTTPTKASTAQFEYTFDGWSTSPNGAGTVYATNKLPVVTGDATYYAHFSSKVRSYTVTFYDEDETTVLQTIQVPYGTTPTYTGSTPTKADPTGQYSYNFNGWSPALGSVTGPTSYHATYTDKVTGYHIIVEDWTGKKATTSIDADAFYSGTTTFTVTSSTVCALGIHEDGSQATLNSKDGTYTRLRGTKVDDQNYKFTVDVTDHDVYIVLVAKGDATLDGRITAKDSSSISRSVIHLEDLNNLQKFAADVDANNRITAKDSSSTSRSVIHLEEFFWDV